MAQELLEPLKQAKDTESTLRLSLLLQGISELYLVAPLSALASLQPSLEGLL